MAKARSPGALAAWIGRRKYGAKKFASMAGKGRTRAAQGKPKTSAPGGGKRFAALKGKLARRR